MSNGLLFDLIKRDAKRFVTRGGYQVDVEMTTEDGTQTINFQAWAVKHAGSFDSDGNQVNTSNAHITVDEEVFKLNNYPYRQSNGEILLNYHVLSYVDSSGNKNSHTVRETFPDENLGLINISLGKYMK